MDYTLTGKLTDFITPAPFVFQADHFGVPRVDAESWTVTIDGLVRRKLELSLQDLASLPQREVTAFHECAGNPIHPDIPQRRVANIKWAGVPIAAILDLTGAHEDAQYLISRGVDHGMWQHARHPAYEKDLPISKACDPSVLLAVAMNNMPLPVEHGGPVRLVVPGYYGTNSTKWLRSVSLSASRSTSAFTTTYYTDRETVANSTRETPVWEAAPNSVIVAPANGQPVHDALVDIWGWCWGEYPISRLDISTDGGHSWTAAELGPRQDSSWQRFTLPWRPPTAGEYCVVSRATDEQGRTQPDTPRRNRMYKSIIHVQFGHP
ncbi:MULTISPECIES: molybdopterin-dependent oxidoreductase [unclassified Streptomyces]|uniref:molybdopterin-dependent oxidoreductase n=1 Tax=unclassified Streptomyces TaxID=2593676 RepID=UPI00070CF14A|nr:MULTISPECIES: molybdopterin-dependent oxidoreductase [unclassified Streptomyces]KQV93513.1 hypothetical protein ASD08_15835 [Streptomyces sp. Root369]